MTMSDLTTSPITRVPLRLRLSDPDRPHPLDGGWWPQTRNLAVEMADLVNAFPQDRGRIVRAMYSPPDWDDEPKRVTTARGYIEVAPFKREFSPVMILTTSERRKLCLVTIPCDLSEAQGEAALEAAVTPYFSTSPTQLLTDIRAGSQD
jgi:uncharacterized protein DUF5994